MIYDALKVALADPERRLKGTWNQKDPRNRPLLKQLSDKLTSAVRFDLDDTFTALVERCSLMKPRKLAYLFGEARAPYDLMWVECSIEPSSKVLKEWFTQHPNLPPIRDRPDKRAGFLIERETRFAGRDSVYRLTSFAQAPADGKIVCWPAGVIWDPIVDNLSEVTSAQEREFGAKMMNSQPNHMADTFGLFWAIAYGTHTADDAGKMTSMLSSSDQEAMFYMTSHTRYVPAGAFGLTFMDGTLKRAWSTSETERYAMLCHEGTGDMRFVASLLGLINTYEITVSEPQKLPNASPAPRVVWGKKVPYLEYRRLALKLPKGKPIEARIRDFNPTLIHKRAHMVRGHNRYYRATGKRVWIKPHQRGDASLGFVKKDYLIEASMPERKT